MLSVSLGGNWVLETSLRLYGVSYVRLESSLIYLQKAEIQENSRSVAKAECTCFNFAYKPNFLSSSIVTTESGTPEFTPFVTTIVGNIAQNLFRSIEATTQTGISEADHLQGDANTAYVLHDDDPKVVKAGKPFSQHPDYFKSVFLDGVKYKVMLSLHPCVIFY